MYTVENFKTKKALQLAVERGVKVEVFEAGIASGDSLEEGTVFLCGPHYPEAHTWYAKAELENGFVVKVK